MLTFPLLSDVGSQVIKRLGILNTEVEPGSRGFGIPHPGLYVVDKTLTVVSKQFEKSYRHRPSAETALVNLLDEKLQNNCRKFSTDYLAGSIGVADSVAYRSQLIAIVIDLQMKDGFHLYGQPIPEGYIPFQVAVAANPNFAVDDFVFPESTEFEIASLGEKFRILPEELDLKTFMRITNKPKAGQYTVTVTLTFQACNDKICLAPANLKFDFPLRIINEDL